MHLLLSAQMNRHTLQLALCGGGIYIYIADIPTGVELYI